MIKNHIAFEIKKLERVYQLLLSPESPLGEIFDVLTEMRNFVLERIQEASKTETVKMDEAPKE
jgi:hypothetical protein